MGALPERALICTWQTCRWVLHVLTLFGAPSERACSLLATGRVLKYSHFLLRVGWSVAF